MKLTATSLLLFIFIFKGFSQGEFNSPFVSERFQIYNGLVHYKVWGIVDFLIQNQNDFAVSETELNKLFDLREQIFPADYLFQEEAHWALKTIKSVPLNNKFNKDLLSVNFGDNTVSLMDVFLQKIDNEPVILYSNEYFESKIFPNEIDFNDLLKVNELLIQEDWVYNKVLCKIEPYVVSVGFSILEEGKRDDIFWVAYPKFKSWLKNLNASTQLIQRINQNNYYGQTIKSYNGNMEGMLSWRGRNFDEHKALIELDLLRNFLKLHQKSIKPKGKFKIKDNNLGMVSGIKKSNKIEGKLKWNYPNGKTRLEINYINGVAEGEFKGYYENGQLNILGQFKDSLRIGDWFFYYEDGVKSAKKHYEAGVLDGKQTEYYPNGSPAVIYFFENSILNGEFTMYYPTGKLLKQGTVNNGIMNGDWKFNVAIDPLITNIINRNVTFWNSNFLLEKKWKADNFTDGFLTFDATFYLDRSSRCLNNLCSSVEVH